MFNISLHALGILNSDVGMLVIQKYFMYDLSHQGAFDSVNGRFLKYQKNIQRNNTALISGH